MCTSGPWMHWQALIARTSPPGASPTPLPRGTGAHVSSALGPWSLPSAAAPVPGSRSGRAVPGRGPCWSGQWPTDWNSDLPWTCLVPTNSSGPLSSQLPSPPAPLGGCGMGPLPHRPCCRLPVPPCSLTAKRKFSKFPFSTQLGATNLYLTYELVFPYCSRFECLRRYGHKTKRKWDIQL